MVLVAVVCSGSGTEVTGTVELYLYSSWQLLVVTVVIVFVNENNWGMGFLKTNVRLVVSSFYC
jgi:hypothetical protein